MNLQSVNLPIEINSCGEESTYFSMCTHNAQAFLYKGFLVIPRSLINKEYMGYKFDVIAPEDNLDYRSGLLVLEFSDKKDKFYSTLSQVYEAAKLAIDEHVQSTIAAWAKSNLDDLDEIPVLKAFYAQFDPDTPPTMPLPKYYPAKAV